MTLHRRYRWSIACILIVVVTPRPFVGQTDSSDLDFEHAVAEFRIGNYSGAAVLFDRIEAKSAGSTDALLYEAKALVHTLDFVGAERALRSYLTKHPKSPDALYLLGFVLHRENEPAVSLEAYTKAASIAPPTGDDLKIVGLNYVLLNDYSDAIHWLEKAVELDPENQDAWYYLGRAYYTSGRLAEAGHAYRTVLRLNPMDARAENNLGLIFETSGQLPEAQDAYRKAIAWQRDNTGSREQPYVNLGGLLLGQGNVTEALELLEKAVSLAPNNAFCRMKLGIGYRQAGRLAEAQGELEKATELDPYNPAAHYQLGRLYKEQHALARAQAEFDRTAELQARASQPISGKPDH